LVEEAVVVVLKKVREHQLDVRMEILIDIDPAFVNHPNVYRLKLPHLLVRLVEKRHVEWVYAARSYAILAGGVILHLWKVTLNQILAVLE